MASKKPQWQLHTIAAQKRELERHKAEELQKVAQYFENNTRTSKYYEQWTTEGYYERASREAELLGEKKIRAAKLEERRKKLELMLFQENMQQQQELKSLASQPKLFKNGSYLNSVPTSVSKDINLGIMAKENELQKREAELRLYHSWRINQPELRAEQPFKGRRLKSAWMEQIVENEMQKKKEEEDTRKSLLERDDMLRRQIKLEEERLKEKEMQINDLRNSLEGQIAELSEKEQEVKELRREEEKQHTVLEQLQLIRREREGELGRLMAERDACTINMGLYKYKLKQKVLSVIKEIDLELKILEKIKFVFVNESKEQKNICDLPKRILDTAMREMVEWKEKERQRQKNIDVMYDGEARQLNDKQDKIWSKEREARASLMKQVFLELQQQIEDRIEKNRELQKLNVLERETILNHVDSFHKEVQDMEKEKLFQNSAHGHRNNLQSQLNSLKIEQKRLENKVSHTASLKQSLCREQQLRQELINLQRRGSQDIVPTHK